MSFDLVRQVQKKEAVAVELVGSAVAPSTPKPQDAVGAGETAQDQQ